MEYLLITSRHFGFSYSYRLGHAAGRELNPPHFDEMKPAPETYGGAQGSQW
jgi:hypothetical protein